MKAKTRIFICNKCGDGHIVMTYKFKSDEVETIIKKCDKCGYQYYFKELSQASLVETTNEVNKEPSIELLKI